LVEKAAWNSFKMVTASFLGNDKEILDAFRKWLQYVLKDTFPASALRFFSIKSGCY
jgi:hypothetical protein